MRRSRSRWSGAGSRQNASDRHAHRRALCCRPHFQRAAGDRDLIDHLHRGCTRRWPAGGPPVLNDIPGYRHRDLTDIITLSVGTDGQIVSANPTKPTRIASVGCHGLPRTRHAGLVAPPHRDLASQLAADRPSDPNLRRNRRIVRGRIARPVAKDPYFASRANSSTTDPARVVSEFGLRILIGISRFDTVIRLFSSARRTEFRTWTGHRA
jgi:hypothetical protein